MIKSTDEMQQALAKDAASQIFEVWQEGYALTGQRATAYLVGRVRASSFGEACDKLCGHRDTYDAETLSVWSCGLFPTEVEARKAFG